MRIAITTLACALGLGLTACVKETVANDPVSTPASAKTKAPAESAGMTTTELKLSKVP